VCLSCHDGTIALGSVFSESKELPFSGGIRFIPQGPSRLGTDLSDDHPISFVYHSYLAGQKGELRDPSMLPKEVKLDKNRELQCTACHNPHDDTFGKFLVMSNQYSALCTTCHIRNGWMISAHSVSSARPKGQGPDPWPDSDYRTVAENGCENCHTPHTASSRERLLKHVFEEDNCLVCHNGNVASTDIDIELTKHYKHSVQNFTRVHDAAENFTTGDVPKHVECVDCHNPHRANDQASSAPSRVSGANAGVTGVSAGGMPVTNSQYLYEICFKCHADNNVLRAYPISRQIDQLNTRLEFDPANPSFHPVESPGNNYDVPSLLQPLTKDSIISCIDCHNTDNPKTTKGPHGSSYKYILARNYITFDYTQETSNSYALCYKCHSRGSILGNQSFAKHRSHIVDQKAPCAACHDPHGISNMQGNTVNNSHLINFDISIVFPNDTGSLYFQDLGRFTGQCFLKCHGKAHEPEMYP
jgi:predicted CXXCH cytochrome family protein